MKIYRDSIYLFFFGVFNGMLIDNTVVVAVGSNDVKLWEESKVFQTAGTIMETYLKESREFDKETRLLIASKANPTRLDEQLRRAIIFDVLPSVQAILEAGVDVNACCNWMKHTPLHLAVSCASTSNYGTFVVKSLLDHGADLRARILEGKTPLDLAEDKRCIVTLLEAGAEISKPMDLLENLSPSCSDLTLAESFFDFDDYVVKMTNKYFSFRKWTNDPVALLSYLQSTDAYALYRISKEAYVRQKGENLSRMENMKFHIFDVCLAETTKKTYLYFVPSEIASEIFSFGRFSWWLDKLAWNSVLVARRFRLGFVNAEKITKEFLAKNLS